MRWERPAAGVSFLGAGYFHFILAPYLRGLAIEDGRSAAAAIATNANIEKQGWRLDNPQGFPPASAYEDGAREAREAAQLHYSEAVGAEIAAGVLLALAVALLAYSFRDSSPKSASGEAHAGA